MTKQEATTIINKEVLEESRTPYRLIAVYDNKGGRSTHPIHQKYVGETLFFEKDYSSGCTLINVEKVPCKRGFLTSEVVYIKATEDLSKITLKTKNSRFVFEREWNSERISQSKC